MMNSHPGNVFGRNLFLAFLLLSVGIVPIYWWLLKSNKEEVKVEEVLGEPLPESFSAGRALKGDGGYIIQGVPPKSIAKRAILCVAPIGDGVREVKATLVEALMAYRLGKGALPPYSKLILSCLGSEFDPRRLKKHQSLGEELIEVTSKNGDNFLVAVRRKEGREYGIALQIDGQKKIKDGLKLLEEFRFMRS
jgi:hypothetical protein